MTQLANIDIKSTISKFIGSDTTPKGIIEAITTSFLLNPQLVLSFVLRAKNILTTQILKELELINSILNALLYINNKDLPITDTAQLTNVQTFLLDLSKSSKISQVALDKYNIALDAFFQKNLNRLKSGVNTKFALTSVEAKEDIYIGLVGILVYHKKIIDLTNSISVSLEDFKSANISKLISTQVIERVRNSISETKDALNDISKIAIALELLAGKAAITSLASIADVLDPIIKTGTIPSKTNITARSETCSAIATTTDFPITTNSTTFGMGLNGNPSIVTTYPRTLASGYVMLVSSKRFGLITIPTNGTLYIRVTVTPPMFKPASITNILDSVIVINLTPGNRTFEQVRDEINEGLRVIDIAAGLTRYGFCRHFAIDGSNQLLIYGSDPNVVHMEVLGDIPGWFDNVPTYHPPKPSVHELLGFDYNQQAIPPNKITLPEFKQFIDLTYSGISTQIIDSKLRISSNDTTSNSYLTFDAGIAQDLGLPVNKKGIPTYLAIEDNNTPVNLEALDIHPGYSIIINNLKQKIIQIDYSHIYTDSDIPVLPNSSIEIYSDLNILAKELIPKLLSVRDIFDLDVFNIQQTIIPVLTNTPSLAQLSDFKKTVVKIQSNLNTLLGILNSFPINGSLAESEVMAKEILYMLETKGMNVLYDLLLGCNFSKFFSMSSDEVSRGLSFVASMENLGKTIPT